MKCNLCSKELIEGRISATGHTLSWYPQKVDKERNIRPKILAHSILKYTSTTAHYCYDCDVLITPVVEQPFSKVFKKMQKSIEPKKHKSAPINNNNIYSTKRR